MTKLHPDCAYAVCALRGKPSIKTMKYRFESRGGKPQRVNSRGAIETWLKKQGFTIVQYAEDGTVLSQSGDQIAAKIVPRSVKKIGDEVGDGGWDMLDLDAPKETQTLEESKAKFSDAEREWLAEEQARAAHKRAELEGEKPKASADTFEEAGELPIMKHIFDSEWNAEMNTFSLQAVARKRGIDVVKGMKKADLIEALAASDKSQTERLAAMHEREGVADA